MSEQVYDLDIVYREVDIDDVAFIYSSMVTSISNQPPWNGLDKSWVTAAQHALTMRMLQHCDMLVACHPEFTEQVYGYIVAETDKRVLHWLYVKYPFRNAKVGGRLFEQVFDDYDTPTTYTMSTYAIRRLEKKWNLVYDARPLPKIGLPTKGAK